MDMVVNNSKVSAASTSNSKSIHSSLKEMQEQIHQLQEEGSDWLKDTLAQWGLSSWGLHIFKTIGWITLTIIIVLFLLSCF